MRKLRFYKNEHSEWYIDLPDWEGSITDLEMVEGADSLLEYLDNKNKGKVRLNISLNDFDKSEKLKLMGINLDSDGGAYYWYDRLELNLWLCDVTKYVFGKFPSEVYFRVL